MSDDSIKTELPFRASRGLLLAVVAFFGAQFLAGILLSIYPLAAHWSQSQTNNWLDNSLAAQFIYVLLAEGIVLGLVYLFLKHKSGGFRAIGLRKPRWSDPLLGLAALPLYLLIFLVSIAIATHFDPHLNVNQKQQLGFNNVHGALQLGLTFIALVILPPIAEETVFRGLVYTSLKRITSLWPAVLITSLLFAAGHLPEGGSSGPLYIAAIDTFSLSLVLLLLRQKTGGLYASMTLHALKNGIAFVSLFALHLT